MSTSAAPRLVEAEAVLEEVVYIESEESKKLGGVIGGHIDDCMLLGQNPAILEINGTCWIGGLGA